ncbi:MULTISPECIES: amino acid adenylation domain-containing protein [unclassified Streptomyces]|uniref:non-ribosomal peptide synthetase n=1 Tax=unclassified Streptomyces TaxID=2593676 RepID=UPI0035DD2C8E
MDTLTHTSAEYWRDVLAAGGTTSVGPWTRTPEPGTAVVETAVPEELVTELHDMASAMGVSPTAPVLAAHAKVLSALSGDLDVTTGYVAGTGGGPLPCRLTTRALSWRALIRHADSIESGLLAHKDFPVDVLRAELGLPLTTPEAVFDPTGAGDAAGDAVLHVALTRRGGRSVLRTRYRTEVIDEEYATRISGYHLAALRLIADDPDALHGPQSLLSPDELRHQLVGLAGPSRALPDLRFHQLFEQRVRAHPDAVAAVQDDRRWTYRELDNRANRLAHALLGAGLGREDVVAVVSGRSLEWLAAVLAVLKSGGAYLPVEPHFPAERVTTMLARAGCRLVLAESGTPAALGTTAALGGAPDALPDVRILGIEGICEESREDADPDVAVAPGDLAYVFFTSGSTGEPKGAMVEHAGMLNHLLAKIDDLGIREGDVVAQTAPQCFDISLWQLLAPLITGGHTLLVGQEAIMDVRRFVDTLADGEAGVVQVVPSYLDVVLSFLERHPRPLPHLHCVSVTGEALKKGLVERWFAVRPGVRLVNAYGLTETSDDTNHAVMDEVPDTDEIPLGRPVGNVRVYLVDEHLSPVPLGSPGAIAFSGVCVGRGYINDPERTRAAFLPDPYRAGERLHLGGDYGRWLPDGRLAFLGRRDAQVKIRGFRIEIGEVENALLRQDGVRGGAVVVAEGAGRDRRLVAFCTGAPPLRADVLRDGLSTALPPYMVPSAFHWREALPLTANGKIDRRELSLIAAGSDGPEERGGDDSPRTPTERRLAAAWAEVLGVPQHLVGRQDDFFARGGTSLSAVGVAVSLDREISLKDLVRHPVLTDLAALIDTRSAR